MKKRALITVLIYIGINLVFVIPYKFYKLHQLNHTVGKIFNYGAYGVSRKSIKSTMYYPLICIKLEKDSFIIDNPEFSSAWFTYKGQMLDVYYKLNRFTKHYYTDSLGYLIYLESNYNVEKCKQIIQSNIFDVHEERHVEVDNKSVIVNSFFWYWLPQNELLIHGFLLLFLFGVFTIFTEKESDGS